FDAAGASILGVSKDGLAKHAKFKAKHDISIPLGSDEEGTVVEDYGVWVEKNMYGKKYMGIERATFLIDGKGIVREVWRKVRVPGHVEKVLDAVNAL
ncbi:MAG: peroxiredoxin, partial [Pseudomonadota bacterium]